jgi:Mat/Ecp fimbriae major subunit
MATYAVDWGNMAYRLKYALPLFAATGAAIAAYPAQAETGTADAQIKIYEQIQFAVLLEMDFGKIISDGTGGTVHMDPATQNRDCVGTITCIGTFAFSRLQLSGSDADVVVTFDPSFQVTGPGTPMTVAPEFPGGSGTVIHLTGGTAVVEFGALLTINPNQAAGIYNGQFSVDISYQ